ncbi:predicted protein [Naegleria gruberi]|uniref:Predicted protein n=1 Tax=Naegleria gruberi TaxID=5762 RepID=D2V0I1_NAEGR|nr:uncharacterized protein NAEGRDRAFT_62303 [Naegleria gruberi]EFC49724.1 predicted protein [Naegleria gruberi]|eukprot:XP_002682468.1 predicted protein [Naegleria gruberi strain NEG-M]
MPSKRLLVSTILTHRGGMVDITSILPTLDIQKELADSRGSAVLLHDDTCITGREINAINKLGQEMKVRISMSFSKCTYDLTSVVKAESEMSTVIVILIHHLTIKNMLKELKEKEVMYYKLQDKINFKEIFHNIDKRNNFKDFCAKEMNEWILFLEDVSYYKSLKKIQDRVKLQTEIYSQFIKNGSNKQLNMSKEELQVHSFNIQRLLGEIDLFDELENVVIQNLLFDVFKRWQEQ